MATGSMSTPSSPSGFVRNLTNPGTVNSTYTHPSGTTGTRFQYRLLDTQGNTYRIGEPFLGANVLSGNNLPLAWANTGLGKLPQASTLNLQARALSTPADGWGGWSGSRTIRTNAPPDIPTNLQPSTGYASSSRPLLSCQATDPDTWDDPPGSLVVTAEIMDDDGVTVKYTRTMAWNASTQQYEYQINSTDEPSYRTFSWRAYSRDTGNLYSGGAETANDATRSAAQTIAYAAAPTVTITGPTSPVFTMTPMVTWTTSDQASVRIELILPDGRVAHRVVRNDPGLWSFSLGSLGWIIPNGWRNNETATLVVAVTNSAGVTGSATRPLLLQYTAPGSATGFSAIPIALPGTNGPNGVEVSWDVSSILLNEFNDYLIQRVPISGNGGSATGSSIYIASIANRAETSLRDYTVQSGQWYRYLIYQRRKVGDDVLWSDPVTLDIMVQWTGIVLHSMPTPEVHCVELSYGVAGGQWEPVDTLGKHMTLHRTLGRSKRVPTIARSSEITKSHQFGLIQNPATGVTAYQQRERIIGIWNAQDNGPGNRPASICWRDGAGGSESVAYGVFVDPPEITKDGRFHDVYRATLTLQDVDVQLGVEP